MTDNIDVLCALLYVIGGAVGIGTTIYTGPQAALIAVLVGAVVMLVLD